MATKSITNRMLRAAKLDIQLFEEVEADTTATSQAFLVVILVSIATGIGAGVAGLGTKGGIWFLWGLLGGLIASIIGWLAWSLFAYIIGTKLFKGTETSATWGELLRTIGFSNSPGVLRIFSFIPFLGGIIAFCASIWTLIAGIIAVRQALDFCLSQAYTQAPIVLNSLRGLNSRCISRIALALGLIWTPIILCFLP